MKFFLFFSFFFLLFPVSLWASMTGGDFEIYADVFSVVQDDLSTSGGNFSLTNTGGEPSGVLGPTATGTIYNTLIGINLDGGEIFLSDGAVTTTFTFRNQGGLLNGAIQSGTITIDTGGGGGTIVGTMTDRIAEAINHANANLEVQATSDGVNTVTLVNIRTASVDGNVPIIETVADAGLVVTGMSGGGSATSGFVLRGGFQAMEIGSISMNVSPATVSLGELSLAAVSSASVVMTITTDSATGYAVSVSEDGNLRKGIGALNDINDVVDGTVTAGSEEYGISTSGVAGLLSSDTAISGTLSVVAASYSVTAQQTTITFDGAVGGSTRAGSYSHIVTFSATANP